MLRLNTSYAEEFLMDNHFPDDKPSLKISCFLM